jgi:hypothetical protein
LLVFLYNYERFLSLLQLAGDGDKSARDAAVLALSSVMCVVGENVVKSNAPTIANDKEKWDKVCFCLYFVLLICHFFLTDY